MITADRIVLATGSRADRAAGRGHASGVPFHTSDTVMRIDDVPARLAILGGGYIAAEFAHVFSAFGAQTTMILRSGRCCGTSTSRDRTAVRPSAAQGAVDVQCTEVSAA